MSNGATSRASSRPLWPSPMMPSVRPWISSPITDAWRSHRPVRTTRSWSGSRLARASMNSKADDAVEWFSAIGALKTATSCSVQAARSILS